MAWARTGSVSTMSGGIPVSRASPKGNYRCRKGADDQLCCASYDEGIPGTGATFEADLNLVVQVVMGAALIGGAFLAKRNRYTAHGICQTTVLLPNLLMIGLVMWPSFQRQARPAEAVDARGTAAPVGCRARGRGDLLGMVGSAIPIMLGGRSHNRESLRFREILLACSVASNLT
jgi:hypothetical protein